MSVVLSKRKLSGIEYINNARKLFIFSLQRCGRFPKRHTFTLSTKITDLARKVYLNIDDAYRTIMNMEHLFYNTFRLSSYEIAQWR